MIIENGVGTRYALKINEAGQACVLSEALSEEGAQARENNAYIIHAECHTAVAASGGFMTITNNDPSHNLEVTRIYIDCHTLTPTDLICTQVFDATISNGTDVSSTAIVQKNRGSSDTFNLTVTASDASSDMTYTGGTQYHAFPLVSMASQQRNMNNTNILTSGRSITLGWKTRGGGNATDGEIVSFSVNVVKVKND